MNCELQGGREAYRLPGGVKGSLDTALDAQGFALVGPDEAVHLSPDLAEDVIYITVVTADEASPLVIMYDSIQPPGEHAYPAMCLLCLPGLQYFKEFSELHNQ